jgi:hypothetical protein
VVSNKWTGYTREALARKIRYVIDVEKQSPRIVDTAAGASDRLSSGATGEVSLSVLLVEDDALIRMGTADMLADRGARYLRQARRRKRSLFWRRNRSRSS